VSILQAILSGVLQGITEFLPVSSSGHLVMMHRLFGIEEPQVAFDVFLHAGTLLAVLIYFRKDLKNILLGNRRLGLLVLLGCVPIFAAGFLFTGFIEKAFVNIKAVGAYLLVTAAWLFVGHVVSSRRGPKRPANDKKVCHDVTWREAVAIGLAQAAALLPGISRSGVTISTGLICGLDKQSAFRYSFLLLIPATLGALGFKLMGLGSVSSPGVLAVAAGTLTAFIIGLISLKILQVVLERSKLYLFGIYLAFLAGVLLI